MTLRYVLLVCVSISVFTAFALATDAKEPAHPMNPYSKEAQEALHNEIKNSYNNERNTVRKSLSVTGDDFDDFSGEDTRGPQPKDALRPTNPRVEKSQIAARHNVTDQKIAQEAGDTSTAVYPTENRDTLKEVVIEVQNKQGSYIKPDVNNAVLNQPAISLIP